MLASSKTEIRGATHMTHQGFSHIGLSTHDLDKTRAFYEGVLGFKPVVANTITIEEGGHLRHMFFDAGSTAALAHKRDELRTKGVETTDIVDHGWAQSIYFKDPNGISLEYCCLVGNRPDPTALMHSEFTLPRAALELSDTLSKARSAGGTRKD